MKLVYKPKKNEEIVFDDYVPEENGVWAYLCQDCLDKASTSQIANAKFYGCPCDKAFCGVDGCDNYADYYINMQPCDVEYLTRVSVTQRRAVQVTDEHDATLEQLEAISKGENPFFYRLENISTENLTDDELSYSFSIINKDTGKVLTDDSKNDTNTVNLVYVDWRDRLYEPEIIGAYVDVGEAERVREAKEKELKSQGYDIEEEVHVWVEDLIIHK